VRQLLVKPFPGINRGARSALWVTVNVIERCDCVARGKSEDFHMPSRRVSGAAFGLGVQARIGAVFIVAAISSALHAGDRRHRSSPSVSREFLEGKALFEKLWEPGKPSPTGGDGLGPVYNEASCMACHNLGGTGGGGAWEHDVVMLTAVADSEALPGSRTVFRGELESLHPGFHNRASIVLHREATDPDMERRLRKIATYELVQTRDEMKVLRKGRRNTPPLFGAGLIDAIPDSVVRAGEKRTFANFPEIKGRVSELPEGRPGRFGWKAQIATLDNFVRAACSNELGLEVPGHHQASLASADEFDPSTLKLDLDVEQCGLLTGFVSSLAPPVQRSPDDRTTPSWGYVVFESIGCATCHAPKLGDVRGIYSDLLLHDMGEPSADAATSYGSPIAPPRDRDDVADARAPTRRSGMVVATEWRTPPLWGVADSAPYLHDGRAPTLDAAIRLHDGEAARTAGRYKMLGFTNRRALLTFLSSLTVSPGRKKPVASSRKRSAGGSKNRRVEASSRSSSPASGLVFTGVF
jgi:CxxC motif-containing protein (DUF1111 family)